MIIYYHYLLIIYSELGSLFKYVNDYFWYY